MNHIGIQEPKVPILSWNDAWPSLSSNQPPTLEEFRRFPADCGWTVSQKYVLEESGGDMRRSRADHGPFLQQWLFFGLLSTVLRDKSGNLVQLKLSGQYVDTTALTQALSEWETFERQNRRGATLRLMEAESALEYARQVVRANLAAKAMPKLNRNAVNDTYHGNTYSSEHLDRIYGVTDLPYKHPRYIDNAVSLSIMVLGETLSAQKAKIMAEMGLKIRGWNSEGEEEDVGWGPPKYVLDKMKTKEWCPRTVRVLLGQLGSSATLLLSSLNNHSASQDHLRKGCDQNVCKVIAGSDGGTGYKHEHVPKLCTRGQDGDLCQEVSFSKSTLYSILRSVNSYNDEVEFPVFRATPETKEGQSPEWKLEIKSWNLIGRPSFATISHVWSDGLGNQTCNGVHPCQLEFINRLLQKVSGNSRQVATDGTGHWFWLDTLGIPVEDKTNEDPGNAPLGSARLSGRTTDEVPSKDEFKALKKRAISQIHTVFKKAGHAIVIDKGLCAEDAGDDLAAITMKVLTSNWMRRLWTLQEAYLSKKLFITFKYDPQAVAGIWNFDDLMTNLTDDNREEMKLLLSIAQLVRRRVFHNIMGRDRLRRLNEIEPRGSLLIANAWRAVRWRTTSKEEDETLALSTLLQLDYRSSTISDAGIEINDAMKRDKMMQDFWKLIDKHYKGSIPPGIIFLPGDKLTGSGFRWAPRTWMSSHDEDHPYPLSIVNWPARLSGDDGLVVRYPGFMLHCRQGEEVILNVLGFNFAKENSFDFPVDREFYQWYRAEVADLDVHESDEHRRLLKSIQAADTESPLQLAIIISRPNPREMVPEIGLLVKVCDSVLSRDEYDSRQKSVTEHYCKIIHRIKVARLVDHDEKTRMSSTANMRTSEGADCYGEVLDAEQIWFVDGFRFKEDISPDGEGSTTSQSTVVDEEGQAAFAGEEAVAQQNPSNIWSRAAFGMYNAAKFLPGVSVYPKVVEAPDPQAKRRAEDLEISSPRESIRKAQTFSL